MRLLYVHERFGALAGAEANTHLTASELGGRHHTIGILHGPATGKDETGWNTTFRQRFALGPGDNTTPTQAALSGFRPDVVYVHKMTDLTVLETLVRSGVPLVRMVHDHDLYCLRGHKHHFVNRRRCARAASPYCVFPCLASVAHDRKDGSPLKWRSYTAKRRELRLNRLFRRMIVVTIDMRDELLSNGFDPARIEVRTPVPHGGGSNRSSSFGDRNLILCAGPIIRGNGVEVWLDALARVKTRFECVMVGEGEHRPFCERRCAELGLSDRVFFKGCVPQVELESYYRECSAVAFSSVWPELLALGGLEAMRYALPVVAFDTDGIKDWLLDGHNGFLVPWTDPAACAARLDDLLRDKGLARRMGENGFKLASDCYDFDRYIHGLETLFERVIAEEGKHSRHE